MPVAYQLHNIPDGVAGIRHTLKMMSAIVKEYKKAPAVRELALSLTHGLPPKKWFAEAERIHAFARDRIRYIKDVRGVETLQTPIQTLRLGQGDCDDHSILIAALLESIGHPTRFVAIGLLPGTFCHVFPQTKIAGKWITLEATKNWPAGKNIPRKEIKAVMTQHN